MFDLEPDEARLLLNIAMMSAGGMRFQTAATILSALEAFRPNHPSVAVAKAVALLNAGKYEMALAFIEENALPRFPDSAMLKAFKGMALIHLERPSEAALPLREAAAQQQDPAAAELAKGLLNE